MTFPSAFAQKEKLQGDSSESKKSRDTISSSGETLSKKLADEDKVSLDEQALKKSRVDVKAAPKTKSELTQGETLLVDRIVAIVNSEIILLSDFLNLQKTLKTPDFIDEALLGKNSVETVRNNRQLQMEYLIAEKVMASEIKRLNLSVTPQKIDEEVRHLAQRNNIQPEDVYRAVNERGLTTSEYRDFLKNKIERQSLIENEIISRLRISDDDAYSEFIKTNPGAKTSVDEYSLAHILFNPRKGGAAAARERAKKALQRIRTGEAFEKVAEQTSEDPQFSTGGFLGTFKSGDFVKEIESAVSGLNPGDVSDVVQTRQGFHLVKLINKKTTVDPRFEKSKDKIKSDLMDRALFRQLAIWLQNKRDEAFVKINEYQK
jgi:peptidyl-prolyl cis-trans isomerase SurA